MNNVININFIRTWYQHLEKLINDQLDDGVFPGVEILFAVKGEVCLHQAWGTLEIGKGASSLNADTVFDIASLTKPIVTATAVLMLQERGILDLEDKVAEFITEFDTEEKCQISIKQLLTHTSGLPAWVDLYGGAANKAEAWKQLMEISLEYHTGSQMVYSCLGFIILGEIIRRLTKQSLAQFAKTNIFDPLQLESTCFSAHKNLKGEVIAPTQYCPLRKLLLRGVVHDENSYVFDEEGGNAGLFSKASEIFRYCEMIIHGGKFEETRILAAKTVENMIKNHNRPGLPPRGLGWDMKGEGFGYMSCGDLFPFGGIGHTGFTGTSLWLDVPSQVVVIILSNRVHISREKKIKEMQSFRPRLHNILLSSLEP
ncbi:MAG: beta-lactamase family protein [SAR324 cluster bacterium]|nr:beta-lactamase family protein [SAR324 cluster bacterium]